MFSLCGGVVVQSSFAMLTAVLAVYCGLFVRLRIWLLVWPLAKISALLPLTQGGLGVREAALAALLVPFGAPAALTVAVGLLWQTIIISGSLLSGLLALAAGRLSARASLAPAAVSRGISPSPAVKSSVGRAVMENQPAPRP
jgi:uncharacterized membrane protein YbhN (UPF0104 family)